jgi:hypothetical protein
MWRQYWVRLWIIQELVLAREVEVYCGPEHCSWYMFCTVLTSSEIMRSSPAYRLVQARENHEDLSHCLIENV